MNATQAPIQSDLKDEPSKDSLTKSHDENAYKVFFVDDENMVLKMLNRHFSDDDRLQLFSFSSGEECLKNLGENPDVIVLDFQMSDGTNGKMNGLETLEKIKEQSPMAEVLMLSSQMDIKVAVESLKKGAVDYVVKDQAMQFGVERAIESILKSKALKKEIRQLSQVIKRDKLLIKGYTFITLFLVGMLSYFWMS